jgi:hypothetical protein
MQSILHTTFPYQYTAVAPLPTPNIISSLTRILLLRRFPSGHHVLAVRACRRKILAQLEAVAGTFCYLIKL